MKITRLPSTENQPITEAKINSPHLAGLTTKQMLDMLNRKKNHIDRAAQRDATAVFRAMGYSYSQAICSMPVFTISSEVRDYFASAGTSGEYGLQKECYQRPNDFYVEQTNMKAREGWNATTKLAAGKPIAIIGKISVLKQYGLDEEDFQEFADYMERTGVRLGADSALKGQITRLTKKHNEEQMAIKQKQAASAPSSPLPLPPKDVQAMKGQMLPNPYYKGSNQYNGPITNVKWQTGLMKNMMTTFVLALDLLNEPIDNINYSADIQTQTDYFYAKSKTGVFVLYVDGSDGKNMKVLINGIAYRLRSVIIANNPRETAKRIVQYYWQAGPTVP